MMNTLLVIIVLLVIVSALRVAVVIINPARQKKWALFLHSLASFLPIIVLWIYRDYYCFEATFKIKIIAVILLVLIFVGVCFALYKEYILYKDFKNRKRF